VDCLSHIGYNLQAEYGTRYPGDGACFSTIIDVLGQMVYDAVIVGAGFAGAVVAERLASQLSMRVLVVEKREHVGGNAYDCTNTAGLMVQNYGPHIFHTGNREVFEYLSQFTGWNQYEHRVLACVDGKQVYLPVNIETLEVLYGRPFTAESARAFLDERKVRVDAIRNARDAVVSQVGQELYEKIFRNYTRKQWGCLPEDLEPAVTARLPVRLNRDTRYFTDDYQGLPSHGFTAMFERMLDNSNIELMLATNYRHVIDKLSFKKLIYTGPIDDYFDCKFGRLPYRSLEFCFETKDCQLYQRAGVVNYPNDHDYTRITEFKHLYCQSSSRTTICREYPRSEGEPYYPIPGGQCRRLYEAYAAEARHLRDVHFVGRLAEYRYMNMDEVVASALNLFDVLRRQRCGEG
jgi:UDP-galactopyranose mutase